jgi:uncharacterized protein YcnI
MFRSLRRPAAICVGAAYGLVPAAFAHVILEHREAPIGSSYRAVLRVPHGCDGSATTAIRVRIPEGVIDVKPIPKPGWTLKIVTGPYANAHSLSGTQVSEGATEIDWSDGNLPANQAGEFAFTSFLASDLQPGKTIYFPVVQECAKGVQRWIDIPTARSGDSEPAPGLKLVPKS